MNELKIYVFRTYYENDRRFFDEIKIMAHDANEAETKLDYYMYNSLCWEFVKSYKRKK